MPFPYMSPRPGIWGASSPTTRVLNRMLATDSRKVFLDESIASGKKRYRTCLITPFAGKSYCFDKYMRGIKTIPTEDVALIAYDNSNSKRFRSRLRQALRLRFRRSTWLTDENPNYTVETTDEYELINRRTFEIYRQVLRFIPTCDYVLIVEDDIEMPPGAYEKMISSLERYPNLATVVAHVNNRRPLDQFDDGRELPIIWDAIEERNLASGRVDVHMIPFTETKNFGLEAVGSAHTGCWMTRYSVLKKLGFTWNEDGIKFVDQAWGYRLNKLGYKMAVDWSIKCKHYALQEGKVRAY